MKREDFVTDLDTWTLYNENRLLKFETQFLRGREGGLKEALKASQEATKLARTATKPTPIPEDHVVIEKAALDELRQAQRDLRWVLGRIAGTPFSGLITRRSGFQRLTKRWMVDE